MPFPSPIAHRASEHARFKTSAVVRGGGEQTIIKLCFKCATVRAGCKDGQSCCSHFRARQYPPQDAVPHVAWLAVDRVGPCANLSPCPQAATTAACLRVPVRQTAPVSCKANVHVRGRSQFCCGGGICCYSFPTFPRNFCHFSCAVPSSLSCYFPCCVSCSKTR